MGDALWSKNQHKNFLYVEGDDDKNVFIHLLNRKGINSPDPDNKKDYFIINNEYLVMKSVEGIDRLLNTFKMPLQGKEIYNRYGIVVDADDNLDVTWQRLRNILSSASWLSECSCFTRSSRHYSSTAGSTYCWHMAYAR